MDHHRLGKAFQEDLLKICDQILTNSVALEKWRSIIHDLVPPDQADAILKLKKQMLGPEADLREVVLKTLQIWLECGSERKNLIQVLRKYRLNTLADALVRLDLGNSSKSESGIWFEVGNLPQNYTGRGSELRRLRHMFLNAQQSDSDVVVIAGISGLGGIGKSTLARKYARVNWEYYDGNVIWINADSTNSMRNSFFRLTKELERCIDESSSIQEVCIDESSSIQELAAKVYSRFQGKPSLFVFDNVKDKDQLSQAMPEIGPPGCIMPHILITSRRNDLVQLPQNQLQLNVLEMSEAVELIRKQLREAGQGSAERLAEALQRFPLALQQAIAYIRDSYVSDTGVDERIDKYLYKFEECEKELLADERFTKEGRANGHMRRHIMPTLTVWKITLENIHEEQPGGNKAIKLVKLLAYLNPDVISVDFVQILHGSAADLSLKLLEGFSMIEVCNRKVEIHRLVQRVIRIGLSRTEEASFVKHIIICVEKELRRREITDLAKECTSHGHHMYRIQTQHSELMGEERVDYLNNLCYLLSEFGNFTEALSTGEASAQIYTQMYGDKHESTLTMKWRVAETHNWMNNFPHAMEMLNNLLTVSKRCLGESHRLTMKILATMANIHSKKGDHYLAVEIYDEIIPVWVQCYGETDWNLGVHKLEKAKALLALGALDGALELFQSALDYNMNNMRANRAKKGIADVAYKKGELEKARVIYKELYEEYRGTRGEKNPATKELRHLIADVDAFAKLQSKRAEVTSELEREACTPKNPKRRPAARKRRYSSSSDDAVDSSEPIFTNRTKPSEPVNRESEIELFEDEVFPPDTDSQLHPGTDGASPVFPVNPDNSQGAPLADNLVTNFRCAAEIATLRNELRGYQSTILKQLRQIKNSLASVRPGQLPDGNQFAVLDFLPLRSRADVDRTENWLLEPENTSLLTKYLTTIGGKTGPDVTRSILTKIFANDLAKEISFSGKGTNKLKFKDWKLHKVIISAVQQTSNIAKITEAETNKVILSWFHSAPDRDGGRERRRKRCQSGGMNPQIEPSGNE